MAASAKLFVDPPVARRLRPELAPNPLGERLAAAIDDELADLLDARKIEAIAEDLGVLKRRRVHHLGLLANALVLSALDRHDDNGGRWLDAQVVYEQLGGQPSSTNSFRKQCRKVRRVLEHLFRRAMRRLAHKTGNAELRGRLADFADVFIPDGCAFKLASALEGYWPGTGNPAELKLHAVFCVSTGQAEMSMSAGSVHDNDGFKPDSFLPGALYIWDLGYNDTDRFVQAARAGAFPLQRLKSGANPIVLAYFDEQGQRHDLSQEGCDNVRLNWACEALVPSTGPLDIEVRMVAHDKTSTLARVVCVPFEGEDRYYLTTLPRCAFTVFDVAELYRLRWEVELLFKSWKGAARVDNVNRLTHRESIETHVWASLVAVLMSRGIHAELERMSASASIETKPSPWHSTPVLSEDTGVSPLC